MKSRLCIVIVILNNSVRYDHSLILSEIQILLFSLLNIKIRKNMLGIPKTNHKLLAQSIIFKFYSEHVIPKFHQRKTTVLEPFQPFFI